MFFSVSIAMRRSLERHPFFGHAGGSVRSKEKCTMSRKDKLAAALLAI